MVGDPINGKKLFMKMCATCHTTEKNAKHKAGPNLHSVVGKTCGSKYRKILESAYTIYICKCKLTTKITATVRKFIIIIFFFNSNFPTLFTAERGFNFSKGMKEKNVVWNEKTLNDYMEFPREFIPGTMKMFSVKKAENRRDLIAYLATLK